MKKFKKREQYEKWEIVECSTQGLRSSMEDSSVYMSPFLSSTSFFAAVFDGHVGSRCSNFLSATIPGELKRGTVAKCGTGPNKEVFVDVFGEVDRMWLESAKSPRVEDGSTALCVALDGAELVVANCGDSRALLCSGGSTVVLTKDHKPTDERESERIVKQGGTVIGGRLQGQLGVSRAFGNYEFKESNFLSSEPEIHEVTLTADVEFLVVGCDGLYEQFTNEEIGTFIKNGLGNGKSLEIVVEELVAEAIDRGSEDNITVIVVKFEKAYKKLLKKKSQKTIWKGF
jgi:serine/threonine protein phosphatase PrpC